MIRPFLALAVLALACDKPGRAEVNFLHNRDGQGTPVVRIGGDSITAEELEQRFAEMSPYARARYQTLEQRKEYVESLARFELLAAEAVRRGLANDPLVVHEAKRVMVNQLLKQELEERPTPVPDAEVQAYYDKHKSDYVKPEMVRLAHVFVEKSKGRARAEEALKKAQALQPLDYQGFGALVKEYSDEPRTRPLEGDMRFLSLEELSSQYGPAVAEAAKKLTNVGQVHDGVVETGAGFHVLKLQGRQAALNLTVDQVRPQIQNVLLHEKKMKRYEELLASLKKSQAYELDEAALMKVEIDLKAPAAAPKLPQANMAPAPSGGVTQ